MISTYEKEMEGNWPHPTSWHLITGEYPPDMGGVADYSSLVAHGLTRAGETVHVWVPDSKLKEEEKSSCLQAEVHRLVGGFNLSTLVSLGSKLRRCDPNGGRILVQYVPHAFGWKALNFPFCLWLLLQSYRTDVWIMFHEVAYPIGPKQKLRHNVLGVLTRLMAVILEQAAKRVFVSTTAWSHLLRKPQPVWLPVPSSIEPSQAITKLAKSRAPNSSRERCIKVGHFGTYGAPITASLEKILLALSNFGLPCQIVLLGRGGDSFLHRFTTNSPNVKLDIVAMGCQSQANLSLSLSRCDLMVQPYPDGVTTRRTSTMASLAHGLPVLTTVGKLTESIWLDTAAVDLVPAERTDLFLERLVVLIQDEPSRRALAHRAMKLYDDKFALRHTIRALRFDANDSEKTKKSSANDD